MVLSRVDASCYIQFWGKPLNTKSVALGVNDHILTAEQLHLRQLVKGSNLSGVTKTRV